MPYNTFNNSKINKYWIVGFTDGEGCFYIVINKSSQMKLKYQVLP